MSNDSTPLEIWDQTLASSPQSPLDWLWDGFVAKGNITLLTSQWKAGKTTLLSLLLSRRKQGGTLAGLAVQPGKSVVVSEESQSLWAARSRRYDFGGNVCFFPQPFRGFPTPDDWQALLARILTLSQQHALDLAVIDPLAPFCPGENHAKHMLSMLLPLQNLTSHGLAVLLLHHPAKGDKPIGQSARGSGALLGHVDISIEMRHPGGDPSTRRRRFLALSRHDQTPRQQLLELNQDGTDYLAVPDELEEEFASNWNALRIVLEAASKKLTRFEILQEWPPDFDKPTGHTLWRWLERALQAGHLAREGAGNKSDPFRYWLPAREAIWRQNPLYEFFEEQRRDKAKLLATLGP